MIRVVLDSPSDSRVPTHGATSVPSMPAFSWNPILPFFEVERTVGTYVHQQEQQ